MVSQDTLVLTAKQPALVPLETMELMTFLVKTEELPKVTLETANASVSMDTMVTTAKILPHVQQDQMAKFV
jgi:hypothetical protein